MVDLGWKSVGVLELTALPSIDEERWVPLVRETDVLLVAGGDVLYLCHWMRQSGLADLLPSLSETVWVGLSAGSMVMTPEVGEDFIQWRPPTGDDSTLGIVDFSICPHLAPDGMPGNSMAEAEQWAAGISGPAYAIDDQTAIKVVDGTVEVVSEGRRLPLISSRPRMPRVARLRTCVTPPRRAIGPRHDYSARAGRNRLSGRRAESVSHHLPAQGGRRLDLVAGVEEDMEQPDRRLVPDHGLPRRRLGG